MQDDELSLLQAILQGGAESGQLDPRIEEMKSQIEQLRGQSKMPGLIDAGAFKVAPSPLAYLGAGANNFMANQRQHQMMGVQQQQAGIRADQNDRVLDALMRMKQQQLQQSQPQMPNSPAMPNSDPYGQFSIGSGA